MKQNESIIILQYCVSKALLQSTAPVPLPTACSLVRGAGIIYKVNHRNHYEEVPDS